MSDISLPVSLQKKANRLKFRIYEDNHTIYVGNTKPLISCKATDQLCSNLHLCFRRDKLMFSHDAIHLLFELA